MYTHSEMPHSKPATERTSLFFFFKTLTGFKSFFTQMHRYYTSHTTTFARGFNTFFPPRYPLPLVHSPMRDHLWIFLFFFFFFFFFFLFFFCFFFFFTPENLSEVSHKEGEEGEEGEVMMFFSSSDTVRPEQCVLQENK